MKEYEDKLKQFMEEHGIQAEHLVFQQSCHSVAEAAQAAGCQPHDLIKSICFLSKHGELVVAIAKGEDRVDPKRLGLGKLRQANPDEMLEKTGYPAGGTPPFGYSARFFIDPRVLEKKVVYAGGGSSRSLIKLDPRQIQAEMKELRKETQPIA